MDYIQIQNFAVHELEILCGQALKGYHNHKYQHNLNPYKYYQ